MRITSGLEIILGRASNLHTGATKLDGLCRSFLGRNEPQTEKHNSWEWLLLFKHQHLHKEEKKRRRRLLLFVFSLFLFFLSFWLGLKMLFNRVLITAGGEEQCDGPGN
jgi:hypothetical protein